MKKRYFTQINEFEVKHHRIDRLKLVEQLIDVHRNRFDLILMLFLVPIDNYNNKNDGKVKVLSKFVQNRINFDIEDIRFASQTIFVVLETKMFEEIKK